MDGPDRPLPGPPGPVDHLVADLARYLATQRADSAATARSRERWLRQVADEEATLAGVLLDLAERGEVVVIRAVGGRSHRGQVRGVGPDFVVLRTGAGHVLARHHALVAVQSDGVPARGADRGHVLDIDLLGALAVVAGDRPRVLVVSSDGSGWAGQLRSVGRDVLALGLDDGTTASIPTATVAEVLLPAGGG